MPNFLLPSERQGTNARWKSADGDAARRVVLIAILARRYMAPTGRGVARATAQPTLTLGAPATSTRSKSRCSSDLPPKLWTG